MKHTPGPWIQQTGMIYRADGFKDNQFSAPDGLLLAQVMAHRDHGPALAIAEANARLIAAAPDLLEALKNAMEHIPTTFQGCALAAIAKAEGKA